MLESKQFLVAGADLHLRVYKAREEVFTLLSFHTSAATESGTQPPAETKTSSAAGGESASPAERARSACSRSLHRNAQTTVLQLPLGNTCAACNVKSPAWQQGIHTRSCERALTHLRQTGITHGELAPGTLLFRSRLALL